MGKTGKAYIIRELSVNVHNSDEPFVQLGQLPLGKSFSTGYIAGGICDYRSFTCQTS
ncbi:Hypothetical protein PAS_chr2-1_0148 [Komagataella phaffii GS115]|uniref:Uncharacterized protein n=1 Tax=Komagataella phaffii (strain GS115 / ATCC 20864) TaxID=644223 RepID=C4QZT1_KOMPG|nr:Hypothetical protein PAS_chr2-1_0148 [Komagataella phaffii GS115]CAY68755.1 Hypothetical protein PAS_chr2-1_0148 [Komagataella phaffii GS115]